MTRPVFVVGGVLAGAALTALLAYGNLLPGLARKGGGTSSSGLTTPTSSGEKPARPQLERIVALARLEPAGGILELGGVPGDRVALLKARPGKAVVEGETLIEFDSLKLRNLQLAAAQAQLKEAEDRLERERTYADTLVAQAELAVSDESQSLDKLELESQKAKIKSLEQGEVTARAEYDRLNDLRMRTPDIVSEQQLSRAKLLRDQAANELAAANEQLKKLDEGIKLRLRQAQGKLDEAKAGRAKVDAAVPLASLRKAVEAAEEQVSGAVLKAPSDGVVLEVLCDQGDTVGQMPLVRMGNVKKMAAVAEVYETQVGLVHEGQSCTIKADALPRALHGKVERISKVVGKNRLLSLDPTKATDMRVVEIRIAIDDEFAHLAEQYVSLQVSVEIDVKGSN